MNFKLIKFERATPLKDVISSKDDILEDYVYSYSFIFNDLSLEKSPYLSFTFHYMIDKYQDDVNLTFDIMKTNSETDNYFFWEYEEHPTEFEEDLLKRRFSPRKKLVPIDGSLRLTLKPTMEQLKLDGKLNFKDVYSFFIRDVESTHDNFIDSLHKSDIEFSILEVSNFKEQLIDYISSTYLDIVVKNAGFTIENYDRDVLRKCLEENLSNNNKSKTQLRIKL